MGINEYGFMADACKWQAFFLGNVLSVMLCVGAGPVKLFPRMRHHKWMVEYFQKYVGPLFSKSGKRVIGDYVRCVTACSEMFIGIVLLWCLWADQLYMHVSAEAVDVSKAWCLCVGITAHFLLGCQTVIHFMLNRKIISITTVLTGLNFLVLVLRLFAWPPWWLSSGNQWLVWTFSMLIPLPFLAAALAHQRWGTPLSEIQNMSVQDQFAERAATTTNLLA